MKYAILSDIHSNPDALERAFEDAWDHDVDADFRSTFPVRGHTHVLAVWNWDQYLWDRFPSPVRDDCFVAETGHRYVVNVGSVGYPRVETSSVYCLFDSETGRVEIRRLPFDADGYARSLRAHGIEIPYWLDT